MKISLFENKVRKQSRQQNQTSASFFNFQSCNKINIQNRLTRQKSNKNADDNNKTNLMQKFSFTDI